MGVVIGDLVLLLVLVSVIGALFLKQSKSKDNVEAKAEREKRRQAMLKAQREAKRYAEGTPLVCLNCDTKFKGPLTNTGCPKCHMTTLVMTEEELAHDSVTQQSVR